MSQEPDPEESELSAVEAALGALSPARGRLDRDRTLYRAGMAAARRTSPGRHLWPALSAVLAVIALGQTVLLARRPPVKVVERVVYVTAPAVASAPTPAPETKATPARPRIELRPDHVVGTGLTEYQRLVWQVLRYGLDGLPPPTPVPPGLVSDDVLPYSARLLRREIGSILNLGGPT